MNPATSGNFNNAFTKEYFFYNSFILPNKWTDISFSVTTSSLLMKVYLIVFQIFTNPHNCLLTGINAIVIFNR